MGKGVPEESSGMGMPYFWVGPRQLRQAETETVPSSWGGPGLQLGRSQVGRGGGG